MCIFCDIAAKQIPSNIVYEDDYTLAFLDLSQTTKGHTLVICKNHSANLMETSSQDLHHVMDTVQKVCHTLQSKLHCDGFNILSNINEVSGQTVMHFHVHVIPRYTQDDSITIKFSENKLDLSKVLEEING